MTILAAILVRYIVQNARLNMLERMIKIMNISNSDKIIMSQGMRFPTMWFVRPVKAQISLRICTV